MSIKRDIQQTALNSSGAGVGQIRNTNSTATWVIRQLALITSPTSSASCTVKPAGIGIVDTSYFAGTGDTTEGEYYLEPGDYLELNWASGPANGTGIATYFYEEVPII